MRRPSQTILLSVCAVIAVGVSAVPAAAEPAKPECPTGYVWAPRIGRCVLKDLQPSQDGVIVSIDTLTPGGQDEDVQGGAGQPDGTGRRPIGPRYEYFVAPLCFGNGPPSGDVNCASAQCIGPDGTQGTAFVSWRRAAGSADAWDRLPGSRCDTGPTPPADPLTPDDLIPDVAGALEGLPIVQAGIRTDPSGETLAQLETVFSANTPATLPLTTTLLGVPVRVDLRPIEWRWTFGDGGTVTTTTPGAPYPSRDVAHVYRQPGSYTARVDVVWGGTFTALGETRDIPGTVAIDGTTTTITVREARARLVG